MATDQVRLDQAALRRLEGVSARLDGIGDKLEAASERLSIDAASELAGSLEGAVGVAIEKFESTLAPLLGLRAGSQEAQEAFRSLERLQGGLAGFERGATLGVVTAEALGVGDIPGVSGAFAAAGAAALSTAGAQLGATQTDRRQQIERFNVRQRNFLAERDRQTAERLERLRAVTLDEIEIERREAARRAYARTVR